MQVHVHVSIPAKKVSAFKVVRRHSEFSGIPRITVKRLMPPKKGRCKILKRNPSGTKINVTNASLPQLLCFNLIMSQRMSLLGVIFNT